MAGVAVPLFSLRTGRGTAIGQYPDIAVLADWCASIGIDLIQLLPLNDTGASSSPYSALSAFALNPVYLDLTVLPGADRIRDSLLAFDREGEAAPRVDYGAVREFKLSALRRIYAAAGSAGALRELRAWVRDRSWLRAYAAFMTYKEDARDAPWWEWPSGARWEAEREDLLDELGDRAWFHVWVQREAELQLAASARAAERLGVRIKGDLPILMSRDSADVWSCPRYFDQSFQAGAPPDMFSPYGQNWGFPPYRWDALEADDYRFWRERIRYAGRFYHAVRIDHVLGFLRIWRIPATERSGVLGHFHPRRLVERAELKQFLDDGRIAWLSVPHTRGSDIDAALGSDAANAKERYFTRLGTEDLYHLAPGLDSESAIESLDASRRIRDFLVARHRDRALLEMPDGRFSPAWYHADSSAYRSLLDAERSRLGALVHACYHESETIWEATGRRLLAMLRESADMLLCAEDLGAVPDCLPRMLSDLGILGLKIERWARDYTTQGHPLIPPREYPRLSVCTPSVHDTTPLRAWWQESGWDREAYYRLIGGTGPCPASLSPELCRAILLRAMRSASLLAVVQIQDYLALTRDLRVPDPGEERVNVPGTVGPENWSYRIPQSIEALRSHRQLASAIRELVAARGDRP